MAAWTQEYDPSEEEVNYDDDLKYKLFFFGERLVQVYKKKGGPTGRESVAVRDPNTLKHIQIVSLKKLRPAKPRTMAPPSPYKPRQGNNTKRWATLKKHQRIKHLPHSRLVLFHRAPASKTILGIVLSMILFYTTNRKALGDSRKLGIANRSWAGVSRIITVNSSSSRICQQSIVRNIIKHAVGIGWHQKKSRIKNSMACLESSVLVVDQVFTTPNFLYCTTKTLYFQMRSLIER